MVANTDQTSWPTMFVLIAMILSYASIIHLVVSVSYDPRIRKGCTLTDTTPGFFSRIYRRLSGRVPPTWLPWAFVIFFCCFLALLAEAFATFIL